MKDENLAPSKFITAQKKIFIRVQLLPLKVTRLAVRALALVRSSRSRSGGLTLETISRFVTCMLLNCMYLNNLVISVCLKWSHTVLKNNCRLPSFFKTIYAEGYKMGWG